MDAGKAAVAVDGKEIAPRKKIGVGTLENVKPQNRKKNALGGALVSRSGQLAPRGGGRRGLEAKKEGVDLGGTKGE